MTNDVASGPRRCADRRGGRGRGLGAGQAAGADRRPRSPSAASPLRTLTREEECFGWAAGYRAAGGMPLVLVQCSGLGNSLNAIGSLVVPYGLGVPWCFRCAAGSASATPRRCRSGAPRRHARPPRHAGRSRCAAPTRRGRRGPRRGRRRRGRARARPDHPRAGARPAMNATEATRALLAAAPDALFVASLGTPTSALRAAGDDGPHLYMGGAMGTALARGARRRRQAAGPPGGGPPGRRRDADGRELAVGLAGLAAEPARGHPRRRPLPHHRRPALGVPVASPPSPPRSASRRRRPERRRSARGRALAAALRCSRSATTTRLARTVAVRRSAGRAAAVRGRGDAALSVAPPRGRARRARHLAHHRADVAGSPRRARHLAHRRADVAGSPGRARHPAARQRPIQP